MKRNSTTLFLQSPGATTPIPLVDNAPDFAGFSEPTLSVLQSAWQDFLDSGATLEIAPDPEPVSTAEPQWTAFNTALLSNANYLAWADSVGAINPDIRTAIVSAAINAKPDALQSAYDIAKLMVPPSLEAVAEWQGLADTYGIDVRL